MAIRHVVNANSLFVDASRQLFYIPILLNSPVTRFDELDGILHIINILVFARGKWGSLEIIAWHKELHGIERIIDNVLQEKELYKSPEVFKQIEEVSVTLKGIM